LRFVKYFQMLIVVCQRFRCCWSYFWRICAHTRSPSGARLLIAYC